MSNPLLLEEPKKPNLFSRLRAIQAKAKPPHKSASGVVAAKRATKIITGMGMNVSAIETLPNGGYRVVASVAGNAPVAAINPWDEVLK